MPWTFYQHTDASAPVLTGQVGSLITLLDACLVNGYGSKTSAGWAKAFTGTNRAAYRMGSGRLRAYLDVNDAAPASAAEAQITAFEAMSAIGTGTSPFPSYLVLRKSSTANATARPWYLVGDDRTFILMTGYDTSTKFSGTYFGEFYSLLPNDNFGCCMIGRHWENTANWASGIESLGTAGNGIWQGGTAGHYICRDETGLVKAGLFEVLPGLNVGSALLSGFSPFPNPADGGLILYPLLLRGASGGLRGRLRGLWGHGHANGSLTYSDGDTVSGTGDIAGKNFVAGGRVQANNVDTGPIFLEASDTVPRN